MIRICEHRGRVLYSARRWVCNWVWPAPVAPRHSLGSDASHHRLAADPTQHRSARRGTRRAHDKGLEIVARAVGASASARREHMVVLSHLYIKTIFLPRQARDKDRENSQKDHFRSGDGVDNSLLFTAAAPSKRTEMVLEAHPPGLEHEGHGSALRVGKKRTAVLTQRTAVLRWVGSADSICQDRLRTAT